MTRSPGCAWHSGTCRPAHALGLRGAREGDAGLGVRPLGESRAVEGRGSVGAPDVRAADRGAGRGDGRGGPPGGRGGAPQVRDRVMAPVAPGGPVVGRPRVAWGSALSSRRAVASLLLDGPSCGAATALRLASSSASFLVASLRCWSGRAGGLQAVQLARPGGCRCRSRADGLVEVAVRVLGEHQRETVGSMPPDAVLGAGERTEPPRMRLTRSWPRAVRSWRTATCLRSFLVACVRAVELLGGPLRLLVEAVDPRGRRVAAGGRGAGRRRPAVPTARRPRSPGRPTPR